MGRQCIPQQGAGGEVGEGTRGSGARGGGHKDVAQLPDVLHRMGLCEVVAQVQASVAPEDAEVAQADAVPQPMVSHQNSFGAPLLDTVIRNSEGTLIVSLDRCAALRIAKLTPYLRLLCQRCVVPIACGGARCWA